MDRRLTKYKRYLTNEVSATTIPRTTAWRWKRRKLQQPAIAVAEKCNTTVDASDSEQYAVSDADESHTDIGVNRYDTEQTVTSEADTCHICPGEHDTISEADKTYTGSALFNADDARRLVLSEDDTFDNDVREPHTVTVEEASHADYDIRDLHMRDIESGESSVPFTVTDVESGDSVSEAPVKPTDLMLLLLKLKHNLTKEATEDIARLVNIASGGQSADAAASSVYGLEKRFITGQSHVQIHHICKRCATYIGIVVGNVILCPFAACSFSIALQDSLKLGSFFLYLPLQQQLIDLLENHEICDMLHDSKFLPNDASADYVSDIYDGKLYDLLPISDKFSRLTITFNCDGVPVFKSSSFSIWPILCVVNELPKFVRHKHVLMTALWFGSGKPDMNVLFKPFVHECTTLDREGFKWRYHVTETSIITRVSVIIGVCDAVARPLVQNFTQFNGRYGCGYCLDEGEYVEKGNGHCRVYPYNPHMSLRSKHSTLDLLLESVDCGSSCKGVKGPSILTLLPHFDIIHGMVPDYMHCVCLGVVRQVAKLWFETKNHDQLFFIGNQLSLVDKRLLSIKPPCSISRTPRSLSVMKFWKAHEWLVWLLFYSLPVLKDILPHKYYAHWGILVECIAILLHEHITPEQLHYCNSSLVCFVKDFATLYGKEHVSFNVHQTLHLVQSVRNWGPLWTHSAFLFESYNAVLLKMVRGTQGVPLQIVHTFCLKRAIPLNVKKTLPKCSDAQQAFISSMISQKCEVKQSYRCAEHLTALGRPAYMHLQRSHYVAMHSVCTRVAKNAVVRYFKKIVVHGEILHSAAYCRNLKRNSFTVQATNGMFFKIETFLITDVDGHEKCYAIGQYLTVVSYPLCARSNPKLKLCHINAVTRDAGVLTALDALDIKEKCIFISLPNYPVDFVCIQVNSHERCT